MKIQFLKKTGNPKLILIFAGWGSDPKLYSSICIGGWDVAVAYDFNSSSENISLDFLAEYPTVYLYAWSLGVAAASKLLPAERITAAFALNGTEIPSNDLYGIPEAIYVGTKDNLTERSLKKFRRRMVDSSEEFDTLNGLLPETPDISELINSLQWFEELSSPSGLLNWNRAYISENDKIFPPASQKNFWRTFSPATELILLDAPHYYSVEKIVRSTIPELSAVATNFQTSLPDYEENATAQNIIASCLTEQIKKLPGDNDNCEILEIGPGSGLFTRKYASLLNPAKATFIELYSPVRFNISPVETYITADAETEIKNFKESFDFILSSCAIQWFSDVATFIKNASTALRPGGYFICSTFLPGTLKELESVRPDPMLYPDKEYILEILNTYFSSVSLSSEEITLSFESARHALLHIRNTGAFGSFPSTANLKELLSALRKEHGATLTYIPLYIFAQK